MENLIPPGWENSACSFHGNFVVLPGDHLMPLTHPNAHENTGRCCSQDSEPSGEDARRTVRFMARSWSRSASKPGYAAPGNAPAVTGDGGDALDIFLQRVRTHTLVVSGMAFQDAWNLDLERLRDCCIQVIAADGRMIPFCAYNLTDRQGHSFYRNGGWCFADNTAGTMDSGQD
jgi:hypothetical protein